MKWRALNRHKLIAAILMTYLLLYSQAICAEQLQTLSTPEKAEEFIEVLFSEDPSSLDGMYRLSPEMEKAVTSAGGWAGLAKSLSTLGEADSIGPAYEDTFYGMDAYRVPCSFSVFPMDLVFTLENGAISGLVTDKYTGNMEETEQSDFAEIELSVPVPALNGSLPGTLTLPAGDGPFPAVILVHGSGPNNKNEAVGNVKPFRDLAEGLAAKGIAVFRYDKRTFVYGTEMASDYNTTLIEETVEDAARAVQIVSEQEKIDSSGIFVLGQSLGATAVPAIAEQMEHEDAKAAGFILMAPAARPLDELMREQYDFLYSLMPEISEEQQEEKDSFFAELDKLKDLDELPEDVQIAGAYVPYWRWMGSYDVLGEAEKIEEPCLLLQGEEDYQVTMEDYNLWREAVGDKQNWKLISYPGLVHAFIPGEKTEGAAVYMKEGHVDSQVISDIAEFVYGEG